MPIALRVSLRNLYRINSLRFTSTKWTKVQGLQNSRHCWTQWVQLGSLNSTSLFCTASVVDETIKRSTGTGTDNDSTDLTIKSEGSLVKQRLIGELREETTGLAKDWEKSLITYSQLDFESDFRLHPGSGLRIIDGSRLVDDPRYKEDIDLWVQLILFRKRVYGLQSLRSTLKEIFSKRVPLHSRLLDSGLLEYAFQDTWQRGLYPLIAYATHLWRMEGYRYDSLYADVVGHFLTTDCSKAYLWHTRLAPNFPPSEAQFKQIFLGVRKNDASLIIFREIYKDLLFRRMYSWIVPKLCEDETFVAAAAWHYFLLMHGDFPPNSSYVEPLLQHLTQTGHHDQARLITQKLVEAGVAFEDSSDRSTKGKILMSRETMNRIQGETYGIAPKKLSDEFCARLFATKIFSVETVIKGLHVLGTEAIGPLALQEIALRACSVEKCQPEIIVQSLNQLKEAGISIGGSVLSRLIAKLAMEKEHEILLDVVRSDLHPEVYEDSALQESLLTSYERAKDQRQINRTLAVLLFDKEPNLRETFHFNLLFRSSIRHDDRIRMSQLFETMKEQHIPLLEESCKLFRKYVLSERQVSKGPATIEELDFIINVWRTAMCGGSHIPPSAWIEILRRLGMKGQLIKYEEVARWLGRWYLDHNFRRSQMSFTVIHEERATASSAASDDIAPRSQLHPCRILFSDEVVRGVITWGFQYSPHDERYRQTTADRRTKIDTIPWASWMWGLQLLVDLREFGVWFDNSIVGRACVNELVKLFGPGLSKRKINRRAKRNRVASIEEYGAAMVILWGPELFSKIVGTTNLDAQVKAVRAKVWDRAVKRAKRIRNWAPRPVSQPFHRRLYLPSRRFDIRTATL